MRWLSSSVGETGFRSSPAVAATVLRFGLRGLAALAAGYVAFSVFTGLSLIAAAGLRAGAAWAGNALGWLSALGGGLVTGLAAKRAPAAHAAAFGLVLTALAQIAPRATEPAGPGAGWWAIVFILAAAVGGLVAAYLQRRRKS